MINMGEQRADSGELFWQTSRLSLVAAAATTAAAGSQSRERSRHQSKGLASSSNAQRPDESKSPRARPACPLILMSRSIGATCQCSSLSRASQPARQPARPRAKHAPYLSPASDGRRRIRDATRGELELGAARVGPARLQLWRQDGRRRRPGACVLNKQRANMIIISSAEGRRNVDVTTAIRTTRGPLGAARAR